ncbi:MAG TPA: hypothetical protein VFN57_12700 [Thermomicrobiaceae bacterium]|nr:hypothetical protein [Thermomicrobiaceae bacterium]
MQRRTFRVGEDAASAPGAVLSRDLAPAGTRPRVTVRRGTPLTDALARLPGGHDGLEIAIVVPEPGDEAQPAASALLARHLTGPGVILDPPHQGQVNVRAAGPGLLRVRSGMVERLNLTRAVLLATALDGRVVETNETVAIVKAPELFVPRERVERALVALGGDQTLWVAAFRARRVGILAGTRIGPTNLEVAVARLGASLAPYGAAVGEVLRLEEDDPRAVAAAYRRLLAAGAEVVLVGGSIVLDPQDPFVLAVERVGGRLVTRGAPVDPGTMFWLAYFGAVPFLGLASCELYGRVSVLDLLLPYALAGEPITRRLIAGLGYGGLLSSMAGARRPKTWGSPAAEVSVDEEDGTDE